MDAGTGGWMVCSGGKIFFPEKLIFIFQVFQALMTEAVLVFAFYKRPFFRC
jgi:hypothetical protein